MAGSSKITTIEKMDRVGPKSDKEGGGALIRTLYVEPYTSHKTLLTALRGTLKDNGDGTFKRILPHNDPLFPQYYCFDAIAEPFARNAISASKSTGFDSANNDGNMTGNGQLTACTKALSVLDDFDFASQPDSLTIDQIKNGGVDHTGDADGYVSKGCCGARVTATYYPVIFMPGVNVPSEGLGGFGAPGGPFDYVDPVWTPEEITTQTGRNLKMRAPGQDGLGKDEENWWGLSDTFAKVEVVWHLKIRRLMVPFVPDLTNGILNKKINGTNGTIGWRALPMGTVRFDGIDPPDLKMGPDGTLWYELVLNFTVRMLWDEYYAAKSGDIQGTLQVGWIDWNHHYGFPAYFTGIQHGKPSYYPVIWDESKLQGLFGSSAGAQHPLYLYDSDMNKPIAGKPAYVAAGGTGSFVGNIFIDPFKTGFQKGQ
jgi:hypothetical protein